MNTSFSNVHPDSVIDYGKIKLGVKSLDDAVLNLGDIKKIGTRSFSKGTIL